MNVFNRMIAISMLVIAFPCMRVQARPSNDYYSTSFSRTKNKIVITVKLNKIDTRLALDTGASATILLPEIAKKLNLKMTPYPETGLLDAQSFMIANVHIGSIVISDVNAVAAKMPFLEQWNQNHLGEPIDGVLGLNTLQQLALGIDSPGNRVAFWKKTKADSSEFNAFLMPKVGKDDSTITPLTAKSVGKVKSPFVSVIPLHKTPQATLFSLTARIDGVKVEMNIDTGTDIVTLPGPVASQFTSIVPVDVSAMNSLKETAAMRLMYLRSIEIGLVKVAFPRVGDLFNSTDPTDALVGMSMFENCRLVLDFPRKKLYIVSVPSQDEESRLFLPNLGIFANTLANEKVIVKIAKESAAYKCGMKDGDEIINIEGLQDSFATSSVRNNSPKVIQSKTITITVRRENVTSLLIFALKVQTSE